ncbi:MAG: argininosuccinate lyase [Anaerolineales bacterium]|nr:argininosuccinate lyase [Anaerolineales bacterium]
MGNTESFTSRLGKATAFPATPLYTIGEELEAEQALYRDLQLHKAHVVMLLEQKIITREVAVPILKELLDLEERGLVAMPMDSSLGLYLSTEKYLVERLGADVAGRMHTARSRNDIEPATLRMDMRTRINEITQALIELKEVLLAKAKEHTDTVMPGYTHHSQQAQPTTFGHFIMAGHDAFTRDIKRLDQAYENINLSPMGGCAIVGTGFPIDRQRVSDLLGFDAVSENTLDATGHLDYLLQGTSAIAIALSNLTRFMESLYLWNTIEFGMVELADEYCSVSSIMPQKKNPVAMEMVRGESVIVANTLNTMMGILKAVPLGGGREWGYTKRLFPRCANTAVAAIHTSAGIIESLTVYKDVMARRAMEGYSTVTELADEIVRSKDLSFRESHHIVGMTTRMAIMSGKMANEITSAMIDEAAVQILGRPLELDEEIVKRALDPVENVNVRNHAGGPAPSAVKRMIKAGEAVLVKDKKLLQRRIDRLARAAEALEKSIDSIIN